MSYRISFGLAIYEVKNNLDKILQEITKEEINNFKNSVVRRFTEYYVSLKRDHINFDKEQLKTDVNLGLITKEEFFKELKKIKENENKINGEVKKYLEQNLKLEFDSKYPTLLTRSTEVITRTGWLILDISSSFINGKIKTKELTYYGKNFKYYKKNAPLIKLWNEIIEEYFELLDKHDV